MSEITERIHAYVEANRPAPESPCLCGSDNTFGDCCGSTAPDRAPPRGIHIESNVVTDKYCSDLLKYASRQPKRWLTIGLPKKGTSQLVQNRDKDRVTREIKLGKWQRKICNTVESGFRAIIRQETGQTLQWYENPILLYYAPDGFYAPHADSEVFYSRHAIWRKKMDRDYSMLFYLNDDYEGGHINFMMFDYRYKPKKGDLILFPSDHRYVHTAEPVTRGNRFAIVSWAAVRESAKVLPNPPPNAIMAK